MLIGAGGFAREVYAHAKESIGYGTEWDIKGFLDGDIKLSESEYAKLPAPLLGDVISYEIDEADVFICAIAEPRGKEKVANIIAAKGGRFMNIIHKTALLEGRIDMGIGNIVSPYVVMTDNIRLGNHISFNVASRVGHDAVIGDFSSFMSNAGVCGYAVIGKRVYMATNAVALPHSKIDDDVVVGVNSVVYKKAESGCTVFGNPAMPV